MHLETLAALEFSSPWVDCKLCPTTDVVAVLHRPQSSLGMCLYRLDGYRIWRASINVEYCPVTINWSWDGKSFSSSYCSLIGNQTLGLFIIVYGVPSSTRERTVIAIIDRETGKNWPSLESPIDNFTDVVLLSRPNWWLAVRDSERGEKELGYLGDLLIP